MFTIKVKAYLVSFADLIPSNVKTNVICNFQACAPYSYFFFSEKDPI